MWMWIVFRKLPSFRTQKEVAHRACFRVSASGDLGLEFHTKKKGTSVLDVLAALQVDRVALLFLSIILPHTPVNTQRFPPHTPHMAFTPREGRCSVSRWRGAGSIYCGFSTAI